MGLDCSPKGCNGGNAGGAIQYLETVAVATESSYSYRATGGNCKSSYSTAIPRGGVLGKTRVMSKDVNGMMTALQNGPVAVAIQADQRVFQSYHGGIIGSGCGTRLDHAVLAVGYNYHDSDIYWIVKNSWGTSWGHYGYVNLFGNACGILNQAVYPHVS